MDDDKMTISYFHVLMCWDTSCWMLFTAYFSELTTRYHIQTILYRL